jgi:predicted metal-dependent hydrolase
MTANQGLVADLLRAAADVKQLSLDDRSQLAQRAASLISELQARALKTGIRMKEMAGLSSARLTGFARMPHMHSDDGAAQEFLEAARMLRELDRRLDELG